MIVLVLGGARSGKSAMAERLAAGLEGHVTYVATAPVADDDFAARVAAHRRRRPPGWATVECGPGPELPDTLAALVAALRGRRGGTVVVSEEVGLGVHPSTEPGRRFRDVLGEVNVAVAEAADRVLLVVAGRALPLERP